MVFMSNTNEIRSSQDQSLNGFCCGMYYVNLVHHESFMFELLAVSKTTCIENAKIPLLVQQLHKSDSNLIRTGLHCHFVFL